MNRKRITALLVALSLVICTGCTEQEQEVKEPEAEISNTAIERSAGRRGNGRTGNGRNLTAGIRIISKIQGYTTGN